MLSLHGPSEQITLKKIESESCLLVYFEGKHVSGKETTENIPEYLILLLLLLVLCFTAPKSMLLVLQG